MIEISMALKPMYPIECEPTGKMKCDLTEIVVPDNSAASNRRILELCLQDGTLVVLISRGDDFFVPGGGTVLQPGDRPLVLTDKDTLNKMRTIIETRTEKPE